MAHGSRVRGARWIEERRLPRYDIWVSRTQVACPWLYHPQCMALWDGALGRPMTQLHGQPAGAVLGDVARAAAALRAQPPAPWADGAASKLEWMRHLCACDPAWIVRVESPAVVSYFDLVAGVLAGVITRDQAVRAACECGYTEAGARQMLNWVKGVLDHYADPAQPGRPRRRQARRTTAHT
jgi:hypothetical protein